MKGKQISLTIILSILISGLIFYVGYPNKQNKFDEVNSVYQIYLDGKKIGTINDNEEFYNLINEDQTEIKNEYNVNNVYPPNGFEIIKYNTYSGKLSNPEEVYAQIKESKPFTIKGYVFNIKSLGDEEADIPAKDIQIYVLDKDTFYNAAEKMVTAFVDAEKYANYLNNSQPEIVETGSTIKNMEWEETITYKEAYISADEKIYTDENELSQYLLFGTNAKQETYKVKESDTIETIAEANKLNTQEFLIANPKFTSANNLLAINEEVVIALINPVITCIYDLEVVEDQEISYETETKYDDSKSPYYSEVTQKGEKGLRRITKMVRVESGAESQGVVITKSETLKDSVTEIIVKGRSYVSGGGGTGGNVSGSYVDTNQAWAWPTNTPYTISSPYGYRWGSLHDAIDISGTGYGSPIYAALEGTVIGAGWGSVGGYSAGISIGIDHGNGIYTVYAHLSATQVSTGQRVSRGQRIGSMGNTGSVSPRPTASNPYLGTHLHFGAFKGYPYQGGYSFNPLSLYR